ncbi:hypothetical protein Tco_1054758 [Tanacetum coccineum]|uniref:Uncharacterized protein n=1 Tax=Tanacetum coccineum TaxID=301880 RepID=A0ABQ5GXQ2_9ASTR
MQVLLLKIQVASLKPTGIFDDAYDDEDVGVEADLNNLETTINVSPIPTTRIHKDHPKDQIIGDINSATQTRKMTKISKEHAMVSYIKKQRRTNHKDYQNCLFAYFLLQIEPKKVIQALTDLSWIKAMQEEVLQFKLQKKKLYMVYIKLLEPGMRPYLPTYWKMDTEEPDSLIGQSLKEMASMHSLSEHALESDFGPSFRPILHSSTTVKLGCKEEPLPPLSPEGKTWGLNKQSACFRDEIIHAVEQHRLESRTFEVKMNQVLSENERLLAQAIDNDIVKTVVNLFVNASGETVNECQKSQSQAKDTVIVKLKEQIKSLKGNVEDSTVKMDMDEIETLNIELEHRVTKLVTENEHLKQTYKQLYDSIKPKRVQSKEQCDALIQQVNIKSGEISDLNAKLQEQGLVIAALKNELRKLKGKALDNEDTVTHSVDPKVFKDNMEPITPKLVEIKGLAHIL